MNWEIYWTRINVKGYGFLSFAKNIVKSLSNKYDQKLLGSAKKSTAHAIKTASKRAIQKATEETCDLIGNEVADKITTSWKYLLKNTKWWNRSRCRKSYS